ncbi:MAG: 2-hydroxychromene-2-carboxylate isomerase [Marinibacterium sp.]|nr:2-hydroxychromene-2-carboxylate isomerase [Marinibacterium sp.]
MEKIVKFHFDFGSPNSYLSHLLVPGIAARQGARFDYVPVLVGGVFRATGNMAPGERNAGIDNKVKYERRDLLRFTERHGIADQFRFNPFFPIITLKLMRGAVAAQRLGVFDTYADRVFQGMWRDEQNLGDDAVLTDWLTAGGLDAAQILGMTSDQSVKDALVANTSAAVAAGDFGSPTFHYDGEIYFGKDRLNQLEEHLAGLAA